MINETNVILLTDSYKLSHFKQYPPKTQEVYSYFESRVGATYKSTVFFGLQYLLRRYLVGRVVTPEKINQAEAISRIHLGGSIGTFNKEGWEYIERKHNGFLPVEIKAVPEGTKVPINNIMMSIRNTDPECYWLTNYLETLLVQVWYPNAVATVSNHVYQKIQANLEETGSLEGLSFKLHDFGCRGVSSMESAGIGGLAHLVNFSGTDTVPAIRTGQQYYDSGVCGFSIPASEHSTITSWGRDGEVDAFRNMLTQYPEGLVACVSDSFDISKACSDLWGTQLKDEVLNRKGTLVVRPDSGDIISTVLDVLKRLGEKFGTYLNAKGFRCLHDNIRVIQGDGCTPNTIELVLAAMKGRGWSGDNIAFGMGGGLLQKVDRDTQSNAFKCSSITVDGQARDVYKEPKGAPGKNSKRGKLKLVLDDNGRMETVREGADARPDILRTVFFNGELKNIDIFDNIRKRAQAPDMALV